jgi:Spy/CpxP family protein refolding chaperone
MRRIARISTLLLALAAGVGSLAAQSLGVPPGRWWERPRVAEQLVLSPEQKDKLNSETVSHSRTLVDLKAAVEKAEIDLRALGEAEPFSGKAAREGFRALQAARQRLEAERFEMLIRVREILTREQWQKLQGMAAALRQERRERLGDDEKLQQGQKRYRW